MRASAWSSRPHVSTLHTSTGWQFNFIVKENGEKTRRGVGAGLNGRRESIYLRAPVARETTIHVKRRNKHSAKYFTPLRRKHPRLKSEHERGHSSTRTAVLYYSASVGSRQATEKAQGFLIIHSSWSPSRLRRRSSLLPLSSYRTGCTYEVHLCIFIRYQ